MFYVYPIIPDAFGAAMHPRLQQDLAQFPQILDHTRQLAEDFLAGLQQRSVCPPLEHQQLQPGDDRLDENGEGALAALERFGNVIRPAFPPAPARVISASSPAAAPRRRSQRTGWLA